MIRIDDDRWSRLTVNSFKSYYCRYPQIFFPIFSAGLEDPEWLQEVRSDVREVAKQRAGPQTSFNEVDHWRE